MNLDLPELVRDDNLGFGGGGLDNLFNLPADDSHASEWSEYSGEEMGDMLSELLMKLKYMGQRLSAKDVCSLAFFATKMGGAFSQKLSDLACNPHTPSGHFQRHLDRVESRGGSDLTYTYVDAPTHDRKDGNREVMALPASAIHELLAEEVLDDEIAATKLATMHEKELLPQCYYDSPVVKKHGLKTFPVTLYLDGVPFGQKDSVTGVMAYNIVTGRRHPVCVLRKQDLCDCGCKGWCTLFPVFLFLRWLIDVCGSGIFPYARYNGLPFLDEELFRADLGGCAIGAVFVFLFLKGDWAEASTLGFPTWSSNYHPCPLCMSAKESLYDIEDWEIDNFPFEIKDMDSYEKACDRCETLVYLSQAAHAYVLPRLGYDKRDSGGHGRILLEDIPADITGTILLAKGLRLEPSREVLDIGEGFDSHSVFPLLVTFWKRSEETFTRHRNPLFSRRSGFTPECLAVDGLHTLSLGVYQFLLHGGDPFVSSARCLAFARDQ